MNLQEPTRTAVVLLAFAVVFVALTVSSYRRESATWDEPQHLTAGYAALKLGDYRFDPEHPPFLRMWAALPLMAMRGVTLDTGAVPDRLDESWLMARQFLVAHEFLYKRNDADRLLYAGRFMIVLLGILLGVLLFSWTRELFGFWPGVAALALYGAEPNILAHCRLVTTDFGASAFIFGTLYFLWRTTRKLSFWNVAGLAGFFALAQVSKFTALLLGPVVLLLLVVHAVRTGKFIIPIAILLLLAATSYVAVWAAYGFRYAPSPRQARQQRFYVSAMMAERVPALAKAVEWIDQKRLLPNAYTHGFLLGQAKGQKRAAFLAGKYSDEGWWSYFPIAFLIKTPIFLILLLLAGLAACLYRWRALWREGLYLLLPAAAFLAVAMTAKLNIGLRHILAVYPFVIVLAAEAVAELLRRKRIVIAVAAVSFAMLESVLVYPHFLAFFNLAVGGPRNGSEFLVDSNLDWGQDLKGLGRWMQRNDVRHINLSYFGTADPLYYGIDCSHLPGAPFFAEHLVGEVRLPGFVAVSVTNLRGVYFNELGRAFYRPLLEMEPVATIGHSIHVYWIERPWW